MPTATINNRTVQLVIQKVATRVDDSALKFAFQQDPTLAVIKPTIFANDTGSDATGTGTAANPYRTMPRAWRDIPRQTGFDRYYIDVTGLTQSWATAEMPQWDSELPPGINFTPVVPELAIEGSVNIYAKGTEIEALAAGPVMSQDPETGLLTISDGSMVWAENQFLGKIARGGGFFEFAPIASNTIGGDLELAIKSAGFGDTVKIYDYGATIDNTGGAGLVCSKGTARVQVVGIDFTNSGGAGNSIRSIRSQVEFYSCRIDGISHSGYPPTDQVHFGNSLRNTGVNSVIVFPSHGRMSRCFFDNVKSGPDADVASVFSLGGCIFDTPKNGVGNVGAVTNDNVANAFIADTLVRKGLNGGFLLAGTPTSRIRGCRSEDNIGNGLTVRRGGGVRILDIYGSGNTLLGVKAEDGAHIELPTTEGQITLSGVGGDIRSGAEAVQSISDFYNVNGKRSVDVTDELTRIWAQ